LTEGPPHDILGPCVKVKNAKNVTRRRMINLPQIEVRRDESFEQALRRFKRQIEQEGILKEIRERKYYEKPSERKRKKARRTTKK